MGQSIRACEEQQVILNAWRQVIQKGNRAFVSKNTEQALVDYRLALQMVRAMLGLSHEWGVTISMAQVDGIIAAMVVTQHNLADLYIDAGLPGSAAEHLCEAHETVFGLLSHPVEAVGQQARQHLHMTGIELMTFIQNYGDCPRTSEALYSTQLAISSPSIPLH